MSRIDWPQVLDQAAGIVTSYTDTSVTLRQLFYRLVAAEVTDNARAVIGWIERHGHQHVTRRDVHAGNRSRFPKATDVDPVLELLIERGWLRRQPDPEPGPQGGRPPSPTFDVNPYAHNTHNAHNPERGAVL